MLFSLEGAPAFLVQRWNALTECERKCRLYLREIKEGWLTEENVSQVNSSAGQHFNLVFTEMVTSQKLTKVPAHGQKGKVWGNDQGKSLTGKNILFPFCASCILKAKVHTTSLPLVSFLVPTPGNNLSHLLRLCSFPLICDTCHLVLQ